MSNSRTKTFDASNNLALIFCDSFMFLRRASKKRFAQLDMREFFHVHPK